MNNLMLGDCLERMKEIPDGSVDMVLADPPYGTTSCKWDTVIDLPLMWEQLKRVIKPNGAIVLFGAEPFSSVLRISNINQYKYDWVWNKKNSGSGLLAKKQPLRIVENVMVFYAKQSTYKPIMEKGLMRNKKSYGSRKGSVTGEIKESQNNVNDDYYPKNIIEISNSVNKGKQHPTQKPAALMEYLIKTYTNEGETVLDFTIGSGTTGVAAKNLGRKFIGIEMDETYFEIAKQRIEEA
jgi:DNA modification methylase